MRRSSLIIDEEEVLPIELRGPLRLSPQACDDDFLELRHHLGIGGAFTSRYFPLVVEGDHWEVRSNVAEEDGS